LSSEEKISKEAAMAAGETSGQAAPRRLVTAGGGRRRAGQGEPGSAPKAVPVPSEEESLAAALPGAAPTAGEPDNLERLLAEEEEIERRTRIEHHETPHFRKETD
jgi:small subunit ribosomal protein S3